MGLVLNTNIAALNASRNLATTQSQQAVTFQRLSTGLRVNSAKDDAAGLYLAQSQTKDIRGLNMATRNASDGISMAQTAEGALDQIVTNLQRINELAIQSANGTYNSAARQGLQKEVDQLTREMARIIQTTEFNGQKLLSTGAKELVMQVGFKDNPDARVTAGMKGGISANAMAYISNPEFKDSDWANLCGSLKGVSGFPQFLSSFSNAANLNANELISIKSVSGARQAISLSRDLINGFSSMRANFGAVMNRFEAVIAGNNIYAENLSAARSRIQDADFAEETANLAKQQVLQQAGVASLSQANQAGQVVLGLL